jgi:hypothetical protein
MNNKKVVGSLSIGHLDELYGQVVGNHNYEEGENISL